MRIKEHPDYLWPLGTIAGLVFTALESTLQVRRRYSEKRRSTLQLLNQDAFRTADAAWQALGTDHKAAWLAWRKWDRLHGYWLFMRVNIPRARAGDPVLEEPPEVPPW